MKYKDDIINSHESVAVYFRSPDCSVCEVLLPKLQSLFAKRFPLVYFHVVDIAQEGEVASEFSVFSAATIIVYFEKKEYIRKSRAFSVDVLALEVERIYELFYG